MLSAVWLLTGALALQAPIVPAPPPAQPDTKTQAATPSGDTQKKERPLHDLFRNLGRDFVHLASVDTAVVAGSGTVASLVAHRSDQRLNRWIVARGPAGYTSLGNGYGDGWTQAGAAVGAYAVGLASHNALVTHVGSDLIRGQALNAVLTRGMKLAVDRRRPSGGPDSLPSGHTSAAMTTAAVLHEHFGWKAGVPAYAAAGLVGWSRLRADHHWLSDVFAGATIGLVAGRTVTTDHRGQWTIVPSASPNRAAVEIFWTPSQERREGRRREEESKVFR